MTTTDLATQTNRNGHDLAQITAGQVETLKVTICKGATDDELRLFLAVAERTGLDPFLQQIRAIKIWDSDQKRKVMVPIVGIDGLRLQAQRSRKFQGRVGPYWCGPDGQWKDIWLASGPPAAAKVGVRHADFPEPVYGIARWSDFARRRRTDGKLMRMWKQMDAHMLAKCAEAQALRAAFPAETSGLYIREEIWQAENHGPAEDGSPGPLPMTGSVDVTQPIEVPSAIEADNLTPPPCTDEGGDGASPPSSEELHFSERIADATELFHLDAIFADLEAALNADELVPAHAYNALRLLGLRWVELAQQPSDLNGLRPIVALFGKTPQGQEVIEAAVQAKADLERVMSATVRRESANG